MNDNLRYVSLQYIKGENYEDVDSFKDKKPDIRGVLNKLKDEDLLDNPEEVKKLYGELGETLEKKKIGESFLEDLINYSSLKLIKTDLEKAKKTAEDKIKKIKDETGGKGDGNKKKGAFIDARSKIAQSLVDVIAVIDMVKRGDISETPPVISDAIEKNLKIAKDYLLGVETAQVKITKIGDKITELVALVDDTGADKGILLQHITSDFDKLKANAIKSVEKFQSDGKVAEIETEQLLRELNAITFSKLNKIGISDGSNFYEIKKAAKAALEKAAAAEAAKAALEKAAAAEAAKAALEKAAAAEAAKAALEKAAAAEAAKAALEKAAAEAAKAALEKAAAAEAAKAALEKAAAEAAKAALEKAAAAKAKVLFDNVEFAITKLNKEIDIVNANVAKFTELKNKVEKLKELDIAAKEVKKAAEALKKAKAPAAPPAQTPQAAQEALSAELKKIEQLLETAKTTLEEAYKLLEELRKSVIEQSDTLEKEKKDYLKSLDKLVVLYSSYLKICTKNISRYDKLFEHNEISNIDEAFMIKSYSDFLKKLNKLKQNLETKDIGKIRRALTDSINRLFNMYGVNTNNEAFMKAFLEGYKSDGTEDKKGTEGNDDKKTKDIDYIINRIINYNLAM
jgi:chemotaxis protein histidine kinase CheA